MSYILDALKKNQSEQAADGVVLRVQQKPSRRDVSAWLIGGVGAVLALNAVLLLWLFVWRDTPDDTNVAAVAPAPAASTAAELSKSAQTAAPMAKPAAAVPPRQAAATDAAGAADAPYRAPAQATASSKTTTQQADRTPAQTSTPASPSTRQPARAAAAPRVPRVLLSDLSPTEQTLYNGFNYSTHIYTDDPSLCAIVVDGERLEVGDAFKGLKVVAITEIGVVFEENRRGRRREVEVSVLDQWDD